MNIPVPSLSPCTWALIRLAYLARNNNEFPRKLLADEADKAIDLVEARIHIDDIKDAVDLIREEYAHTHAAQAHRLKVIEEIHGEFEADLRKQLDTSLANAIIAEVRALVNAIKA